MPVVPVKPVSTELTNVTATPEQSSIGDLGQALGGAADKISPIALDMQMRKNADFVMQAETTLRDAEREHRKLVEERKGKSAYGVTQESESWWAETKQRISNDLENNAQRKMFHEVAEKRRHVSLDTISGYEALEVRKSHYESAIAQIENAKVDAWEQPYNTKVIDEERDRIVGTFADIAASEGWKKDKTDFEIREALNEFHMGIVSKRLVDSPLSAELYYKNNEKEIFDEENKLKALIKARLTEHDALAFVDKHYTGLHSYGDVNKKISNLRTPEMRKAARNELRARRADDTVVKQESEERNADTVRKWLASNPSLQKSDIDPSIWEGLSGTDQLFYSDYIIKRDAMKITAVKVDDPKARRNAQAAIDNNEIRGPEDLEWYRPNLTSATMKALNKSAILNTKIDQNELRKIYEARINRKRDNTAKKTRWTDDDWTDWLNLVEYAETRAKESAQGTDVQGLVDEFLLDNIGYSRNKKPLVNDPDSLAEAIRFGRKEDFFFTTPDEYRGVMEEVARQTGVDLGTGYNADSLYTNGGRTAIEIIRSQGKKVTPEIVIFVMGELAKEEENNAN